MNYPLPTRALELAETRGFMKAVIDADTGQILGICKEGMNHQQTSSSHGGHMMPAGEEHRVVTDQMARERLVGDSLAQLVQPLTKHWQ